MEADVTQFLADIGVPTLVLNRADNPLVPADRSRAAAEAMPRGCYVELAATDHLVFSQGLDEVMGEIEEFLTGARKGVDPDRLLTTLLFTDIEDSTALAASLGDRRWRDLLDRHHELVRTELERFGGREVSITGDGFFATFDRPASGVRCATSIVRAAPALGLQVRAGAHTGEVEVRGPDLGGLGVHIAARVAATASGGEVLVSGTVKDLAAGTDLHFTDRGEHELKGIPGTWRLYRADA
jgi:class 3 adenylate cyclase